MWKFHCFFNYLRHSLCIVPEVIINDQKHVLSTVNSSGYFSYKWSGLQLSVTWESYTHEYNQAKHDYKPYIKLIFRSILLLQCLIIIENIQIHILIQQISKAPIRKIEDYVLCLWKVLFSVWTTSGNGLYFLSIWFSNIHSNLVKDC